MRYKIIADSSADLKIIPNIAFSSVPLKIITDKKEYTDNAELNTDIMIEDLKSYRGTSRSSCPNAEEWFDAFEDYDCVFCVTITSGLSGSCNAANIALNEYLTRFPERKGFVIDTLSTGPENVLIIEKLCELIQDGFEFEEIKEKIGEYMKSTHLIFCLESLRNLANNGRVHGAVAKITGILGIRVIGLASSVGTLEISSKARGGKKALEDIYKLMLKRGYSSGKVRIHHCQNKAAAEALADMIKADFPDAVVVIGETGGLCSFYAESGGLLVGFEG